MAGGWWGQGWGLILEIGPGDQGMMVITFVLMIIVVLVVALTDKGP